MPRYPWLLIIAGLVTINVLLHLHGQTSVVTSMSSQVKRNEEMENTIVSLERQLRAARTMLESQSGTLLRLRNATQDTHPPAPASTLAPPQAAHHANESLFERNEVSEEDLGWYQNVEDIPKGSTVWVTFVNGDGIYREMMSNWAFHLRELHVPHLVIAFDDLAAQHCADQKIPYIRHLETLVSGDFRGDFAKFRKMGSNKPLIVLELLQRYRLSTVIISDVDTAWMRNPVEFLTRHPTADVLISTDCLSHWVEAVYDPKIPVTRHYHRCGHMPNSGFGRAFNTGTIIFRNREATKRILSAWRELLIDPDKAYAKSDRQGAGKYAITDQLAFNILLEGGSLPIKSSPEDWRVVWAFNSTLRLMPLPVMLFASGHVFFYQHLPQKHSVKAYVVHCTFQRHHKAGKRLRLREEGLWLVDSPEYYSQGNFMTYDNDVTLYIDSLAAASKLPMPDLFKHFHAMSYQLASLRDAFSFAHLLNRTLVMPRFVCYCDQDWYASVLPHCRVDSSDLDTPFICPLDIMMNPAHLDSSQLPYRTASFLYDKKTPAQVQNSREPVYIDTNPEWVKTMRYHNVGAGEFLHPREGPEAVVRRLAIVQSVRMLQFKGLRPGTFGGFDSVQGNEWMDQQMADIMGPDSSWCCSGEQPIPKAWIDWRYILPEPLTHSRNTTWQLPTYVSPPHCQQILDGEAGKLNVGFVREANHPCNFLAKKFDLPKTLTDVLPSTASTSHL